MNRNELLRIAEKYKSLSSELERFGEEKAHEYGMFSDWIEDNIDTFDEDDMEEDLLVLFKEQLDANETMWDIMFPEGDEDDSITDFLTK